MLKGILVMFGHYLQAKRRKWLLVSCFIIMLIMLVQCVSHAKYRPNLLPSIIYEGSRLLIPEHSALRSVIHVESVQEQTVVTTVIIPASIQAIPANTVAVLPPLTGQITAIFKAFGDSIVAGEPLFTMVAPDLAQALATKTNAEAAYTLAQKNLNRQRELALYKINALRDLEQAESDMQQAEAELLRSTVVLQALHLDPKDQDVQGNLVVRSPITGVVTAVTGGVGMYWSDLTSPVLKIADLSKVYAVANAQDYDLPDFYLGQETQIIFDNLGKSFAGRVEFIDPILSPDTRTVPVGFTINNSVDKNLKPNMFGRMIFKRRPHQHIVLPLTAVIQRGFDAVVFLEVAPWQFEPRVVNVGLQLDDRIVIESGLVNQDRVAMTGGIFLND